MDLNVLEVIEVPKDSYYLYGRGNTKIKAEMYDKYYDKNIAFQTSLSKDKQKCVLTVYERPRN